MSSELQASRWTLEQQASHVHGHAAEHDAAVQRLRECSVESWGPDPIFAMLRKVWADCCNSMIEARSAESSVMYGTGDGIVRTSRNLEAAEHASQMPQAD
ncbi:hypothetical protein ACIBEJ_39655 [Nonomuraea sp. NPDC050790]|uniref:hypothetical protein n=1 Tax=Nonomuraea sp. NPDC050790 TaxID=3364371 RepID=UPI0037930DD3